jgi:hypothetical protein
MIRLPYLAQQHIRSMENRITRQAEEVVRLNYCKEDASEAIRRLELMRKALVEMTVQLGRLCLTEQDSKRPETAVAINMLYGRIKATKGD